MKLLKAFLALFETIAFLWIELRSNLFLLGAFLVIYGRGFTVGGVRRKKYDGEWDGDSKFYKVLNILVQLLQGIEPHSELLPWNGFDNINTQ